MQDSISAALERLNQAAGIKGSAVVTADGIMIKSALIDPASQDVVSGLISFLLATTRRSLADGGLGKLRRFAMHCTHGKVVLCDLGSSCLVVVTDQFTSLDDCLSAVDEASSSIGDPQFHCFIPFNLY